MLGDVVTNAETVIVEGRDRIQELRATSDARKDIAQYLGKVGVTASSGSETEFRVIVSGVDRMLGEGVFNAVYFIGREAILNAFRHARARLVEVEVVYGVGLFCLLVRDDGVGMAQRTNASSDTPGHWGLVGMRERALVVGAELEINSGSRAGTEVQLKIAALAAYEEAMAPSRWRFGRGRSKAAPTPPN